MAFRHFNEATHPVEGLLSLLVHVFELVSLVGRLLGEELHGHLAVLGSQLGLLANVQQQQ